MQVKLQNTWFTPGGIRLRAGIHSVPGAMKKFLPSSAKILKPGDLGEDPPERDPLDPARVEAAQLAEAAGTEVEDADKKAATAKAKKFKEELEAEEADAAKARAIAAAAEDEDDAEDEDPAPEKTKKKAARRT